METASHSDTEVHFESFEFDFRTHELFQNGSKLKIRGHPVDVLAILLEHPGELVTRETIQKRIWPEDTFVDFEQILNNSVGKLRDALGDKADSPHFIETLPRLGYRFIALVEKNGTDIHVAQTLPIAETQPTVPVATDSSKFRRISRRWFIWPVAAFVVTVLAACGYWYVRTPLPAPYISYYEQLTLDGTRKVARATDGIRVYVNLRGPEQGVAQIPATGGNVTEFPIKIPGGSESSPMFSGVSPDGSNLLVIDQFNADEGYRVWTVGIMGQPVQYMMRAYTASWAPDGRRVVYTNSHGDIYTISTNGGEPRLLHRANTPAGQITQTHDVRWSPDGNTIRFTGYGGRMWEMSSTGANLHEWLPNWNNSAQKCCGNWTADGQFYLFLAGRALARDPTTSPLGQLWAVDERQGRMQPRIPEPILLASRPLLWGNPVPSRDGTKIFARGVSLRGELERFDLTSKHLEPYLGGISAEMPDFSRDGKFVAYVSFPDGILWRANRDGNGQVQLTKPPFYPRNPRWSPDGAQILFTDNTQKGVDVIYTVTSQGGTPQRLLPDDGRPQSLADWSPDGNKVVYSTFPGFSFMPSVDFSKVETRIVELATGRVTILPQRPGGFFAPLWSPDGRYIAGQVRYVVGQSVHARELVIFDLERDQWKALVQEENIGYPNWSHDGRFIYFVRRIENKTGVYRVSVQNGKVDLVFDLPEGFRGTGYYDYWMSLDPDDAPLLFRDVGTDEIYALTLERQ